MAVEAPELERLGAHILQARRDLRLSQSDLAERSSLTQVQISYFELGRRRPNLDQLLRIAKALDVPIQRLLSGSERPGESLAEIAVELRRLGIEDLWIKGAVIPGAFRRPEEVISLALSSREPDPRIVEAIPAVLAWNEINPTLLRAYGAVTRTTDRMAWLADIALSIERQKGFPGGCQKELLGRFLKGIETAKKSANRSPAWDSLGKPLSGPPPSPIWRRWRINYDASLDEFEGRARHLNDLRMGPPRRVAPRKMTASRARRGRAEAADTPRRADTAIKPTASEARKPSKEDGPGRQ